MWEIRLSGSERGWVTTRAMGEILWHRRETRRQTEKTNVALQPGEFPAYSKPHPPLVLGDHQPLAAVSGEGASWEVPVHLITARAEVSDAFLAQGFVPGLVPRRPALGGMADLTQVVLRAFDSGSLLRGKQSAGTEHPSTPAGRDGPSPGSNTPRDR